MILLSIRWLGLPHLGLKMVWGPGVFSRAPSGPVLRDTARLSQRYPPIARYGVFGVSAFPMRDAL